MEDRFLIQECATWIRRLAARIKQYQPQLAKKAVDWLHRKEIQGSPLRDAETISDSETPEVRKEREGYETAIALSYECDRLREELAKARSATLPPKGHTATRWVVGPDGNQVTLFFNNVQNMEAFLIAMRTSDGTAKI